MAKKELDLSAFKMKSKDLLNKTEEKTNVEKKVDSIIEKIDKTKVGQGIERPQQVGRPPKALSEKESKPITLKFTESQYDKICRSAGDVPLATFLKRQLIDNGHI